MNSTKPAAIARQWHIIQLLVSKDSYVSSQDVKDYLDNQGFSTDIRTIQRDLQSLDQIFHLECNKNDKPYSWRWRRVPSANNQLTLSQALVFLMIDSELSDVLPADVMHKIEPLIARSRYMVAGVEYTKTGHDVLDMVGRGSGDIGRPARSKRGFYDKDSMGGGFGSVSFLIRNLAQDIAHKATAGLKLKTDNVDKKTLKALQQELIELGLVGLADEIESLVG